MGLADYYGLQVVEGRASGLTCARYYPGGKKLLVKLIADRETHRLVGAQIVAGEGVTGRINWLTAAILKGATAEEFVNSFENAYCPPTSMSTFARITSPTFIYLAVSPNSTLQGTSFTCNGAG